MLKCADHGLYYFSPIDIISFVLAGYACRLNLNFKFCFLVLYSEHLSYIELILFCICTVHASAWGLGRQHLVRPLSDSPMSKIIHHCHCCVRHLCCLQWGVKVSKGGTCTNGCPCLLFKKPVNLHQYLSAIVHFSASSCRFISCLVWSLFSAVCVCMYVCVIFPY